MTDKQQPPERIWLLDSIRGLRPVWVDHEAKDSIPYARVHPVDDARVASLWRRVNAVKVQIANDHHVADQPTWADVHYLLSLLPQLSSSEPCVCGHAKSEHEPFRDHDECLGCRGLDEPCSNFQLRAETISSSERRCGECGRPAYLIGSAAEASKMIRDLLEGEALTAIEPYLEDLERAAEACVFPATGAVHDLVARIQARAGEVENAGNDSGNKKDAEFIKGGVSALRVLADDIEDGSFPVVTTGAGEGEQRGRRVEIALGYINRAANKPLSELPCRVDEMTEREHAIFKVRAEAIGTLQFIAREIKALEVRGDVSLALVAEGEPRPGAFFDVGLAAPTAAPVVEATSRCMCGLEKDDPIHSFSTEWQRMHRFIPTGEQL